MAGGAGRGLTLPVPERVGAYQVLGVLGRGAMGLVLRARHVELDAVRALKVMLPTGDASSQRAARFAREAQALTRVRHPNVVAVHEAGSLPDGSLYFAMDLVEGQPLDRVLRGGALPVDRALEVAQGIAEGVAALHAAGVIHRDLKPGNVVLAGERPVVIDLGLAVDPQRDQRLTQTGAWVGTPAYMAPEQLEARPADPRMDVYALGSIAFELATGTPAIDPGDSAPEVIGRILSRARPRAGDLDPDLPARFDALIARAMSRAPEDRPPSAAAFAQALAQVRAQPGPSCRAARRRRALGGAALAGAGALALGLAVWGASSSEPAAPGPAEPTTPAPTTPEPTTPDTPPRPRPLSQEQVQEGDRQLRRLQRLDPPERQAAVGEWLEEFAGHPRADQAREVRRLAGYEYPAASLPSAYRGVLLAGGEAALLWSLEDGLVRVTVAGDGAPAPIPTQSRGQPAFLPTADGGVYVAIGREMIRVDASGEAREAWSLKAPARALALAPDGERVALAVGLGVELRRLGDGELLGRIPDHGAPVFALAFAPDGSALGTGSGHSSLESKNVHDLAARVWELPGGALRWRKSLDGRATCAAFVPGPDGERLLVGTDHGRVFGFAVADGALEVNLEGSVKASDFDPSPPAHLQSLKSMTLLPGGRLATVACGTRRLGGEGIEYAVWDASSFEQLVRQPLPVYFSAGRFAVRGDGEVLLLLAVADGPSQVWRVNVGAGS